MKTIAIVWTVLSTLIFILFIRAGIVTDYEYDNSIGSYWSLSDKASTLPQKSAYLNQFVSALESSHLEGSYDAVWLRTPDVSFEQNMVALKSLQQRMQEIQGIDVKSFEYQQAISQITAQEQGEASHMLSTFYGCWYTVHHFVLWGWVGVCIGIGLFVSIIFGIIGLCITWYD